MNKTSESLFQSFGLGVAIQMSLFVGEFMTTDRAGVPLQNYQKNQKTNFQFFWN